uniref:Uncharacterized protein n=1 Tax=Ananas comosus var. bracteatus TaxID=296719 RepID=A0A6V7PVI3_ANACO|nr:unnamed protein product [Ananas comosus var. bracteatus]
MEPSPDAVRPPSQTSGHHATSLPESIPDTARPPSSVAYLPPRPPTTGQPYLPGCVALSEPIGQRPDNLAEVISGGLATRFGGSPSDYKVASFSAPSVAVFFPNWVARGSAIGRSPLSFDGFSFRFSNWVETGENERDTSFTRVNIRCQNVNLVPEVLYLMVEDRHFTIPVEVESWEEANPILLGEDLDSRLGLDSRAAQEAFLRLTGFTSVPPASSERGRSRPREVLHRDGEALLDNGDHRSSFTVGMAEAHLDDGNRRCTNTVRMTEAHLDNGNRRCTNTVRMTVVQPVDVVRRNTFPGSECGGLLPGGEDSPNPLACTLALPRCTEQQNEAGLGPACELPPLPIAEADHLIPDLGRSDEPFEPTEPGLGLSRELLPQPMADADQLLPDLGLGRLEPIEVIPTPSLIGPPSLSDFSPGIGSPANDAAMIRASSSALVARVPPWPSPFAWTARRQESSLPFGEALDLPPKIKAYP